MGTLTVWWNRNGEEFRYPVNSPEEAAAKLEELANADAGDLTVYFNAGGLLDVDGSEWYSGDLQTDGMNIDEYAEWLKETGSKKTTVKDIKVCALCGKEHMAHRQTWRTVYKQNDGRLSTSYYAPRLEQEELYALTTKESVVCVDRMSCRKRQLAKIS